MAHQTCKVEIFNHLHELFDQGKVDQLKQKFTAEDILATRNSILLLKALKKEKTREVYICRNSFNAIQGKYPFMCRFSGSSLYLDPKKTKGYPSEILDRRLYLGDQTHAQNETILHNLGITHVLNVTDWIPNKFEDSKTININYHCINIEDSADVPIHHSFSLAYDFIDKALKPSKQAKTRLYQTDFEVVQNFKDAKKTSKALVSSAAKTNNLTLDLANMTTSNVRDSTRDKMYDLDKLCENTIQQSNNQNRVLVHCAMGRSRSATMIIMYLMMKFQLSMDHALDITKIRRDVVDPNEGFLDQLTNIDGTQYDVKTIDSKISHSTKNILECGKWSSGSNSSEDLMEKDNECIESLI